MKQNLFFLKFRRATTALICYVFAGISAKAQVNPGGVAGAQLWLKSTAGVQNIAGNTAQNGDSVALWLDQSGNGNNPFQNSSGRRPVYLNNNLINFNPQIKFFNTAPYSVLDLNSNLGMGGKRSVALFGVGASNASPSGAMYFLNSRTFPNPYVVDFFSTTPNTVNNRFTYENVIGNIGGSWSSLGVASFPTSTHGNPTAGIAMGWRDQNGSMYCGVSGHISASATDAATQALAYANDQNGLQIGMYTNYGTLPPPSNGPLCELIAYNRALSDTEWQKVTSYLCIKYGSYMVADKNGNSINGEDIVAGQLKEGDYLASDGSLIWRDEPDYAHRYYIAGIGRDDASGLNQKQSKSIFFHPADHVTIGLGTVAASNAANTNTFNNDKTFLIWGDNGIAVNTPLTTGSTNLTTFPYNGNSNNIRMKRTWRVQNTGVTQAVTIQFPKANVGTNTSPSGGCTAYVIIYSTDSTFNTGVTATVLTTSGTNYVANHKFPQGTTYFTFAKVTMQAPGTVYLPLTNLTAPNLSTCTNAPGWKYYYYDAFLTQKAFAINWNGNAEPGGVNGVETYNNGAYTKTSGSYQCNVMGRLLEILPAGGSYTVNGGVNVRIFFDSTEMNNSLVGSPLSQRWFKYSGDANATIAANNGQNISSANFLTPVASGEEDGVDFVEFSGITSFSTFGFASNTGINPLPVDIVSFTGIKKGTSQVSLNWSVENEFRFDRYEVEQSNDAVQYTKIATVKALGNGARGSYAADVVFSAPVSYYRLKLLDNNGNYKYSSVIVVKSKADELQKLALLPNPVKGDKVTLQLSGYRGIATIKVYDQYGRMVLPAQTVYGNGTATLNVSGLSSGTYYIKAVETNSNEASKTEKLLLIH